MKLTFEYIKRVPPLAWIESPARGTAVGGGAPPRSFIGIVIPVVPSPRLGLLTITIHLLSTILITIHLLGTILITIHRSLALSTIHLSANLSGGCAAVAGGSAPVATWGGSRRVDPAVPGEASALGFEALFAPKLSLYKSDSSGHVSNQAGVS